MPNYKPFTLARERINKMHGLVVIHCDYRKRVLEYDQEYHNQKLQTNSGHREQEPHNNRETSARQTKQSNQLSFPHQDDCKTGMGITLHTTKHKTITDSHNGSNIKQWLNNNRTAALERTAV